MAATLAGLTFECQVHTVFLCVIYEHNLSDLNGQYFCYLSANLPRFIFLRPFLATFAGVACPRQL